MATLEHKGTIVHSIGELPAVGTLLPAFTLTGADLDDFGAEIAEGRRLVLNIFPSIDTRVCAISVRRFNELASTVPDTLVLCVSADLPMAASRFCAAEGLANVVTGSSFRSSFGTDYGVALVDGPQRGLLSRAVIVADAEGTIRYTEQVANISTEPNYDAALAALA